MDLTYAAVCALALIAGTIVMFVVLIKSFKLGGPLHGILGLVTGGLYTFVWGWLRSKQHQLVKPMLLWTVCLILVGALIYVSSPTQMLQALPYAGELGLVAQKPNNKTRTAAHSSKKQTARKPGIKTVAKKPAEGEPLKNADWNTQAVALWNESNFTDSQKAADLLQKAIQEDPNFSEAYNNRGNAYRSMKQYALAMQDYNKAISLNPNLEKAYNNRGNVYFDQRNFQMAIRDYNKAISLKPSYGLAYLNRGLAYHELKKDDLACRDFQKACELGDCDGINWSRKGGLCQ